MKTNAQTVASKTISEAANSKIGEFIEYEQKVQTPMWMNKLKMKRGRKEISKDPSTSDARVVIVAGLMRRSLIIITIMSRGLTV